MSTITQELNQTKNRGDVFFTTTNICVVKNKLLRLAQNTNMACLLRGNLTRLRR